MNPAMHSTLAHAALAEEVHRYSSEVEEEGEAAAAAEVHLLVSFGPCRQMHLRVWYHHPLAVCGAIGWRRALCPVRWGAAAWLARENENDFCSNAKGFHLTAIWKLRSSKAKQKDTAHHV